MFWLTASFNDEVVHGFARNLLMSFKLSGTEIFGGESTSFIDDIDQNI